MDKKLSFKRSIPNQQQPKGCLSLTGFTSWIVKRFIKGYPDINDPMVRTRVGFFEGWVSIIGNLLLFGIKIAAGILINSIALIADAVHTLSDSATSAVVVIGFKIAEKPSDKEHPFGHGKMESVSALILSVLLFIAGFEILKKSAYGVNHPQETPASLLVIFIISATIAVKEMMARFSYNLGDMIDSSALKADGLHHRSDVLATGLVVIVLVAARFGYRRIDGVMGIVVSLIIFYSAYKISKEAINPLLGQAPSKEILKRIEAIAKRHAGVLGVHDIIVHKYGRVSIISFHIEVSGKDSIFHLHDLSEEVEEDVGREIGGKVIVHIDPVDKDYPGYDKIALAVKEIIDEDKRVHSFYELRIIGSRINKGKVVFDIALEEDADEKKKYDIIHSIQNKFKQKFPNMKIVIKAEPKYSYNL